MNKATIFILLKVYYIYSNSYHEFEFGWMLCNICVTDDHGYVHIPESQSLSLYLDLGMTE